MLVKQQALDHMIVMEILGSTFLESHPSLDSQNIINPGPPACIPEMTAAEAYAMWFLSDIIWKFLGHDGVCYSDVTFTLMAQEMPWALAAY